MITDIDVFKVSYPVKTMKYLTEDWSFILELDICLFAFYPTVSSVLSALEADNNAYSWQHS